MAMPGEEDIWSIDSVGTGPNQQTLRSSDVPGLAYNADLHLVEIWEVADGSGNIWFSLPGAVAAPIMTTIRPREPYRKSVRPSRPRR